MLRIESFSKCMETAPGLWLPAGYRYKVRHHFHIPKGEKKSLSRENIQESEKNHIIFSVYV
jgi:hypothetical protein